MTCIFNILSSWVSISFSIWLESTQNSTMVDFQFFCTYSAVGDKCKCCTVPIDPPPLEWEDQILSLLPDLAVPEICHVYQSSEWRHANAHYFIINGKTSCDMITAKDLLWLFLTGSAFSSILRRLIKRTSCTSKLTENPRGYILMCEIRALKEDISNPRWLLLKTWEKNNSVQCLVAVALLKQKQHWNSDDLKIQINIKSLAEALMLLRSMITYSLVPEFPGTLRQLLHFNRTVWSSYCTSLTRKIIDTSTVHSELTSSMKGSIVLAPVRGIQPAYKTVAKIIAKLNETSLLTYDHWISSWRTFFLDISFSIFKSRSSSAILWRISIFS